MSFTSNQIAQLASDLAGAAWTYVVHHEDLLKAPGSRDFMTSTFTDKVFFKNFLAQLDRMGLDYFTEFTPEVQPEDGLAYEPAGD